MKQQELKAHLKKSLNEEMAELISKNEYALKVEAEDFRSWKRTFVGAYLYKIPTCPQVVAYIADALNLDLPDWDCFTKVNLIEVRDYITQKVSPNTARTYCAYLASVLNDFKEEKVIPCTNVNDPLSVKRVPSQHTYLTEEEIEKLHNYEPRNETERTIKRWFMVECYTGARTSDARKLNIRNIKGDKIVYISDKTKIEASVPMHRNLLQYLVASPCEKSHNRSVVNNTLRSICERLGINKVITLFVAGESKTKEKFDFVSTHTARRSFATNLALAGERIAVISAYMGHTSIEMTSKYIVIDTETLEVNKFFL